MRDSPAQSDGDTVTAMRVGETFGPGKNPVLTTPPQHERKPTMRKTKTSNIKPAIGRKRVLLEQIWNTAEELAKVAGLEMSGVRDGDGYWHGSDVVGAAMQNIVSLIEQYQQHMTVIEEYERDRLANAPAEAPLF
jgi:hypothetical protein